MLSATIKVFLKLISSVILERSLDVFTFIIYMIIFVVVLELGKEEICGSLLNYGKRRQFLHEVFTNKY